MDFVTIKKNEFQYLFWPISYWYINRLKTKLQIKCIKIQFFFPKRHYFMYNLQEKGQSSSLLTQTEKRLESRWLAVGGHVGFERLPIFEESIGNSENDRFRTVFVGLNVFVMLLKRHLKDSWFWFGSVLWHINPCRLFNAKYIFM